MCLLFRSFKFVVSRIPWAKPKPNLFNSYVASVSSPVPYVLPINNSLIWCPWLRPFIWKVWTDLLRLKLLLDHDCWAGICNGQLLHCLPTVHDMVPSKSKTTSKPKPGSKATSTQPANQLKQAVLAKQRSGGWSGFILFSFLTYCVRIHQQGRRTNWKRRPRTNWKQRPRNWRQRCKSFVVSFGPDHFFNWYQC